MHQLVDIDAGIDEGVQLKRLDEYTPALEFPRDNEFSPYPMQPQPREVSPSPPPASTTRTTVFRLIRLHSAVLSRSQCVAVLDGHSEVSIGRDVAPTARVRLKEMAVSKFHASIYWNGMRRQWNIVDMGSMHGTFVCSAQETSGGIRLSDARKSSMPRVLRHLDKITVGGTTLLVHEHDTGRPCPQCATDGTAEIPLFLMRKEGSSEVSQTHKRKRSLDSSKNHPKRALSQLKSSLLSRHATLPSSSTFVYKDRSALRRELHPESHLPPPLSGSHPDTTSPPTSQVTFEPPPISPAAVPSSNIGHKLLLKLGWSPGTALGEHPDDGLVEPIKISSNSTRTGLGASLSDPYHQTPEEWREYMKHRRWEDICGG